MPGDIREQAGRAPPKDDGNQLQTVVNIAMPVAARHRQRGDYTELPDGLTFGVLEVPPGR